MPQTGDNAQVMGYLLALAGSLTLLGGATLVWKRTQK
ncbi:LPXTG cell wall anchor domain-containing protein [Pseudoflavonifractor capillosus]